MTPQEKHRRLHLLSLYNNSSAAMPMDLQGQPLLDLPDTRASRTAWEAFAISSGNADLYAYRAESIPPTILPPLDSFELKIKTPKVEHTVSLTRESTVNKIMELLNLASKNTTNLYAPYLDGNTQIFLATYVQECIEKVKRALTEPSTTEVQPSEEKMVILPEPKPTEIVESVTRAFMYPSLTPIGELNDIGPGNNDAHLITSFRRGDKGHVVATYGQHNEYAFFVSEYGNYGWINKEYAATESSVENKVKKVFYTGGKPLFYMADSKRQSILPGDTLYKHANHIFAKKRGPNGEATFAGIFNVDPRDFTEELDISNQDTLHRMADFLSNLQMPYMWSVFDCSEVMRRTFLLAGIQLRKHSGDMMHDLAEIAATQYTISNENELADLQEGVHVMNLLSPVGEERFVSRHMFFVVKNGNDLRAFSYAYGNIFSDNGKLEEPIGPHVCGIPALEKQLEAGKRLQVSTIAF